MRLIEKAIYYNEMGGIKRIDYASCESYAELTESERTPDRYIIFDAATKENADFDLEYIKNKIQLDLSGLSRRQLKEIKYDMSYLAMAEVWSLNSHAKRHQVGCIVVKDGMIVSDGYNGMPAGMPNACEDKEGETKWEVLHAEANALCKLARSMGSAEGSTLYVTFSPCRDCAKMLLQSGVKRLVFTELHSNSDGLVLLAACGVSISRYFI